jgi:hypothetical protein
MDETPDPEDQRRDQVAALSQAGRDRYAELLARLAE